MTLLIKPDTAFISKGSVLASRAGHCNYYGGKCPCQKGQTLILIESEVTLLIKPDTAFIRKGSVLANRAGHCIYWERSLLIEANNAFIR